MRLQKPLQKKENKSQNSSTGRLGEQIAARYLVSKGYRVVELNFRAKVGEIDIIAIRPNGVTTFIEVKAKVGTRFGAPFEALTFGKRARLHKTIQFYMLKNRLSNSKLAFEVVSIVLDTHKNVESIKHFDNVSIE